MSYVTNIILNLGLQGKKLEEVNQFFDGEKGFISCDDDSLPRGWYGGTKMLEVDIAIGAFNYIDLDKIKQHIQNIKWEEPEDVQLLICDQEDNVFSIWTPTPITNEDNLK